MNREKLREMLREIILQELVENTTAGLPGYLTPHAFQSKRAGKNRATKFAEKLGFKVVERPKRPSSTKLIDYR